MSEARKSWFPVRLPMSLIDLMDQFLNEHPELAITSRQELARRGISDWIRRMKAEITSVVANRLSFENQERIIALEGQMRELRLKK